MKHALVVMFLCWSAMIHAQDKVSCKGTSKSGAACKSPFVNKQLGYCTIHNPNRVKCTGKTTKGAPCGMMVNKGATTCRLHQSVTQTKSNGK